MDIVMQLREEGFITHMARLPRESKILHAAADEIECLRAKVLRLRAERDEARREVCYQAAELDMLNKVSITPESVAEEYNWNCFKTHQK